MARTKLTSNRINPNPEMRIAQQVLAKKLTNPKDIPKKRRFKPGTVALR